MLSSEVGWEDESEGMKKVGQESAVRRPLIRAVLPRVEGQVQVRRPPEFTVPQGAGFKSDSRNGNSNHKTLKSGKQAGHQGNGDNGTGKRKRKHKSRKRLARRGGAVRRGQSHPK